MLIALGSWFAIDSPIYTAIYSYFLLFVLIVSFFTLLLYRIYRSEDARFIWYMVFGIIVLGQFGLLMDVNANSPYFAAFLTIVIPGVFVKTIFSRIEAKRKAVVFVIAFALMAATRLTYLLVHMWQNIHFIDDYAGWLLSAVMLNGGVAFFVSLGRLSGAVSMLSAAIEVQSWEAIALAASSVSMEAVTLSLPIAAIVFAGIWGVKQHRRKVTVKQDNDEQERQKLERIVKDKEEQERAEQERIEKAKRMIKSAKSGDTHAQYELGMLHLDANNYDQAVPLLQAAADKGDTKSQYELGQLYCKGAEGFKPDIAKTYVLLEKAAEADHMEAQFLLGAMYFVAAGIDEPDYTQAALWWSKAAANDHVEATGRLANLHTMSDEFPEADGHLAIKLFKKLANEKSLPMQELPINIIYYNPAAQEETAKPADRATKRARADEIKAELYWLGKGIKEMEKFLEDFADDWDWRNEETQKKLHDDRAKVEELKFELEQLTKRKIV